jgi:hypothetical protein
MSVEGYAVIALRALSQAIEDRVPMSSIAERARELADELERQRDQAEVVDDFPGDVKDLLETIVAGNTEFESIERQAGDLLHKLIDVERVREPHVVVIGNPGDGFTIMGPFWTYEAAHARAERVVDDWWVVPLDAPEGE